MPQPRKGNWVIERLENKHWFPYYRNIPLSEALRDGKRLQRAYPTRVFRLRHPKSRQTIPVDIL